MPFGPAAAPVVITVTPLEHMLAVLRDENADPDRKDRMAAAAAPYIHPRLANVEMKVEAEVTHLTAEQRVERARQAILEAFAERPVLAGASHGPLIEHEAVTSEPTEAIQPGQKRDILPEV
jgi:hypothetical protein